jgi:hypothetical protein
MVKNAIENGKEYYEVKSILEGLGYTVRFGNFENGEKVTIITWK